MKSIRLLCSGIILFTLLCLSNKGAFAQMRSLYVDQDSNNIVQNFSFYSPYEGYVLFENFLGFTKDSGKTFNKIYVGNGNVFWNGVNIPIGISLNGVYAFSKNVVLVYGDYGGKSCILYSSDGANSFNMIYYDSPDPGTFSDVLDMTFPAGTPTGFAITQQVILKTSNSGQSWTPIYISPDKSLSNIQFLNNSVGYVEGNNGLMKTTDGGNSWTIINHPGTQVGFYFLNQNTGWVSTNNTIYSTYNGGTSWKQMNDLDYFTVSDNFHFVNDSTGYALNFDGFYIFKTSDSGKTWERLERDNNYSTTDQNRFNNFFFLNPSQFWAGGGHGFIEMTTNGGGSTIPKAVFSTDFSQLNVSNRINFINRSKIGYSYNWFKNSALFSTSYNSSYISARNSIDTIKLVVSNGRHSDTFSTVIDTRLNPHPCFASFQSTIDSSTVHFGLTDSSIEVKHRWDFGDGNFDTVSKNPVHFYNQIGSYKVTHIVTNTIDHCKDSVVQVIQIVRTRNCLKPDFTYTADSFYNNRLFFKITYDTTTESAKDPWKLVGADWGDGTTDPTLNPHKFDLDKQYRVCLSVQNKFTGCLSSICKPVQVIYSKKCDADFIKQSLPYYSETLTFNTKPVADTNHKNVWIVNGWKKYYTGNQNNWQINFYEYQSQGYVFNVAGSQSCSDGRTNEINIDSLTKTIQHIVYDSVSGCADTVVRTITVPTQRLVSIKAEPSPSNPAYVSFYAYTVYGPGNIQPYSGRWRIVGPDGNYSVGGYDASSTKLTYTFLHPGRYTIAIGNNTCDDQTGAREVYYFYYYPKVDSCLIIPPDFSYVQDTTKDLSITFIDYTMATNYLDYHNQVKWYFGDGDSTYDRVARHNYAKPGTYNVRMVYTSSSGCSKEITKPVTVVSMHCRIHVNFTYSGDTLEPATVQFKNLTYPDSAISYKWYFGNLDSSSQKNPQFIFKNAGTYKIQLHALRDTSCNVEHDTTIVIKKPICAIRADFVYSGNRVVPANMSFKNQSTGAKNYIWYFGDGTAKNTDVNPQHTYMHSGIYTITLIASSFTGCADTMNYQIEIIPNPDSCTLKAKFVFYTDSFSTRSIQFINRSVSNEHISNYTWNFGDSTGNATENPIHLYAQPGKYLVCLSAKTVRGCIDQYCDSLIISKPTNTPIQVFPNPVGNTLIVVFNLSVADNVDLLIFNETGRLVKKLSSFGSAGTNTITIPVSDLQSGVYILQINSVKNPPNSIKFFKL